MKRFAPALALFLLTFLPGLTLSARAMPAAPAASFAQYTAVPRKITKDRILTKAKSSWTWYVARASGLVAAALLILLILFGIGLVTGHTYRLFEPVTAWAIHRAIGLAFGACVLIHILTLMLDKYQPYTLVQVLVPFMAPYTKITIAGIHLGSFFIALGIFAFYTAAVVILSSLLWMNSKPKRWRWLHYFSYLLVILTFFHGLFTGTDLKHGLLRILWLVGGGIIAIGIIMRLRRARTTTEK